MTFLRPYDLIVDRKEVLVIDVINQRISKLIVALGVTKTAFANRLNVSQAFVSKMCSGDSGLSDRTIKDICEEFRVNEPWLRTGEGEMFKELSKEQELTEFFADVLKEDASDFKRRLISVLSRLEVEEWELLESMAMRLAEEGKKETSGQ